MTAFRRTEWNFGLQRAVEAPGSAQQIHDTILRRLEAFAGDAPVVDDRSLVVIRRDPPGPASPPPPPPEA